MREYLDTVPLQCTTAICAATTKHDVFKLHTRRNKVYFILVCETCKKEIKLQSKSQLRALKIPAPL